MKGSRSRTVNFFPLWGCAFICLSALLRECTVRFSVLGFHPKDLFPPGMRRLCPFAGDCQYRIKVKIKGRPFVSRGFGGTLIHKPYMSRLWSIAVLQYVSVGVCFSWLGCLRPLLGDCLPSWGWFVYLRCITRESSAEVVWQEQTE